MDAHPIMSLLCWLDREAGSIPGREMAEERGSTDIGDLKRRIATGEYRLDAHAIAEAMFGRADRESEAARGGSTVLEARELDHGPGRIDHL